MLLVRNVIDHVISFYPPDIREQIEAEIPQLSTRALRLALEVVEAEERQVPFAEAVLLPEFHLMGRVHFGIADLLKWRMPPEVLPALRNLIAHAANGGFDPDRQLLFAVATRTNDPDAALCRFLLWEAVYLNLLVQTWHQPAIEVLGVLAQMEWQAEQVLRDLLVVPDMVKPDTRPLHILVAEMMMHTEIHARAMWQEVVANYGEEIHGVLVNAEAMSRVRELDAREAALFWPGRSDDGPLGSQQIADRYPHHFPSANALEQRRSRFLRRRSDAARTAPSGERFIDMLMPFMEDPR